MASSEESTICLDDYDLVAELVKHKFEDMHNGIKNIELLV